MQCYFDSTDFRNKQCNFTASLSQLMYHVSHRHTLFSFVCSASTMYITQQLEECDDLETEAQDKLEAFQATTSRDMMHQVYHF